jgi:hypothetical protein
VIVLTLTGGCWRRGRRRFVLVVLRGDSRRKAESDGDGDQHESNRHLAPWNEKE